MANAPTKKVEAKPLSRREEILQVAARVIAERGFKEATVRGIGEAAGILSGSLYHHFDSKEQMVVELLQPSLQAYYDEALEICQANAGLAALTELIRKAIQASASDPHYSIILRNETRAFNEVAGLAPIAELRANVLRLWREMVEAGIELGEVRSDLDPEVVVLAILDGTLGGSRWFDGSGGLGRSRSKDARVVSDSLVNFYVAGLRP